MITEKIVFQSAGSLSVAFLSLLMAAFQIIFYVRKPRIAWYGWGSATSFSSMLYAIGIFLEYNAPPGNLNRVGGLLEFTALLFLIHCMYGFFLYYLGIEGKRYQTIAGIFHVFVLILLWGTDLIVADSFVARDFIAMPQAFVEPGLGPLGFIFELYVALSVLGGVALCICSKTPEKRYRFTHLLGILFWIVLGIHDGAASLGFTTFQYVMEYGFFGYSMVVLWTVFDWYVDVSAEDKYRVITEFANDGILIIQDGKTVFGNQACSNLVGKQIIGLPAETYLDMIAEKDRKKLIQYFKRPPNSAELSDFVIVRIKAQDLEERFVDIKTTIIRYRNRTAVLVVIRDITERILEERALKETEGKNFRLRKMESLGLLTGGVAHDLNNVLSGIVSYPDLILRNLPTDSRHRKSIEIMQDSGLKAAAIVQDLLTVTRGAVATMESLDLNGVIQRYLQSPEYKKLVQFHPAVTMHTELNPTPLNINAAAIHIGKTVMNLVSNAFEAIEDSGIVTISTMSRHLDRPISGYKEVAVGDYAILTVSDDGPGISNDDLNRIFEPFYTKKVMGRSGTGLGLAVVWNVVQDHAGYIHVNSSPQGTTFTLYFPTTHEAVSETAETVPMESLYGHGEVILVIDDVKSQRELSCRMLETLKYQPIAISSGEAAIEYVRKHRVDLLLLDMIMDPGINGCETYNRIKKIHPRQKAIIISGFANAELVDRTRKMGVGQYLKKPVLIEELGLALKKELNA